MSEYDVLIDTDALVPLVIANDTHRKAVLKEFQHLREQGAKIAVTNFVVSEAVSMLSRRFDQQLALQMLQHLKLLPTIHINKDDYHQTIALFEDQTRNNTSFVDMSNVVVMRHWDIPSIFSFDAIYAKDFDLEMIPNKG